MNFMMSEVIFDIKNVRNSGTVRRDKNHASVMSMQPMSFLVKRNPAALPQRPDCLIKPVGSQKSDLYPHYIKINFISLHQRNLML